MISITKPEKIPQILENRGKTVTDNLCQNYLQDKADYQSGKKKFEFASDIYGSKSVKTALIKAQHGKCFLCESRITHISYGDVEHFRPKGGWCQTKEDKIKTPGYYWLAYNWANLFLSCQLCNQRFKKNLFPLENETDRAISHEIELRKENPLFVNPSTENPEDFISFRGITPYAIDENPKGEATIENAGLKREEINENRLELYLPLKELYLIANGMPETPFKEQAQEVLQRRLQACQSNQHQYSAMFRSAIKDNFKY